MSNETGPDTPPAAVDTPAPGASPTSSQAENDAISADLGLAEESKQAEEREEETPGEKPDSEKPEEGKEPEFTDEAAKRQRDYNLKQFQKLADEKKALAEERAELEKLKSEAEGSAKPDAKKESGPPSKEDPPEFPTWYKRIEDSDLAKGNPEESIYSGEQLLRNQNDELARQIARLEARVAKVDDVEAQLGRYAQAEQHTLARTMVDCAETSVSLIKERFGVDVLPADVLTSVQDAYPAFDAAGKIPNSGPTPSLLLDMWEWQNREMLRASKPADAPGKTPVVQKTPPLGGGGPGAERKSAVTDDEKIAADLGIS